MFYPFLRGRQNELLALRELLESGKLQNITPIVEPVKASPTLLSLLERFSESGKELILVENPIVGSFANEIERDVDYQNKFESVLSNYDCLIGMRYCGKGLSLQAISNHATGKAFFLNAENRPNYVEECIDVQPKYTIVSSTNQRLQRKAIGGKIALDSSYTPKKRNADYSESEDDFLSEELFYPDSGCIGFSDYSVIGNEYIEGGFMPKVVALHLVYADDDEEQLKVKHFLSPEDASGLDVGMKFHLALGKLIDWADCNSQLARETEGLISMREIHEKERFPGLGVAKKLALKHHIEMVNEMIGERR